MPPFYRRYLSIVSLTLLLAACSSDGSGESSDPRNLDTDNDGVVDSLDDFPNDPSETTDTDGDGVGDNADAFPNDPSETADSDGDDVGDNADALPNDPSETADSDGDGVGDNADTFPNDASESADTDGDGVGDNGDNDIDGDGVENSSDAFPYDPTETTDTDGDGVGDNADAFPSDASETKDTDGDGLGDNADAFPNDANETIDTDGDGVGNNADEFPNDPSESADSDGDGVGDNADAFPNDPTETKDTDDDNVGDNADVDFDGDGLIELYTLEHLDWMRNDLEGTSLDDDYTRSSKGCPSEGCEGYELMADLDFDTNGDGIMDANDTYYDTDGDGSNKGWQPIQDFETSFNGNGFRISNLYINRPDYIVSNQFTGLFARVRLSSTQHITISNVHLDGPLMSITGYYYTGGLVGYISSSSSDKVGLTISNNTIEGELTNTYSYIGGLIGFSSIKDLTGPVTISGNTVSSKFTGTSDSVGGLMGYYSNTTATTVSNNMVISDISGDDQIGGLFGKLLNNGPLTISENIVSGDISGSYDVGGLFGYNYNTSTQTMSSNVVVADISGAQSLGGLGGNNYNSGYQTLSNNMITSDVISRSIMIGGLLGESLNSATQILSNNLVSSAVSGSDQVGAFIGRTVDNIESTTYTANYFNNDETDVSSLSAVGNGDDPGAGVSAFTLTELQCPTTSDSDTCSATTLYDGWDSWIWDFGTASELPGLVIDDVIYRDANGDGTLTMTNIQRVPITLNAHKASPIPRGFFVYTPNGSKL